MLSGTLGSQECPAVGGTTQGWWISPREVVTSVPGVEPEVAIGQQGQWSEKRAGHRCGKNEDKLEPASPSGS